MNGIDLLILALASFRLTHLLVFDTIAEPVRRLVTRSAPQDQPGQDGEGSSLTIADLITCYWCCGVWVSAAVALSWFYLPQFSRLPLLIFAVAGAQAAIENFLHKS